jgi:hypothetical protein
MFIDAYMMGSTGTKTIGSYNYNTHHYNNNNNTNHDEETIFTNTITTDNRQSQATFDSNGNDVVHNNIANEVKLSSIRYKNSSNQHAIRITENPLPETATC